VSFARPTIEQERWIAAAARLELGADSPPLATRTGGWKGVRILTRCALFVLGAVAAGLTVAIVTLLHLPGPFLVAGAVLVAVAESLVARRRLYGAGIEEALGVGGLLLVGWTLVDGSGAAFELRLSLVVALALAIAGLRFLNPALTTLAAVVLSYAIGLAAATAAAFALPRGVIAGGFSFAAAALALGLGAVRWRRPSHDLMLDWLVVVMPVAGYLWLESGAPWRVPAESRPWAIAAAALPALMPALLGAASAVVGIRRRRHAPILAAMGCVGCLAYQLRHLTGLSLEIRLIVWGSVALVVALSLDRYLRTPRGGITSSSAGAGPDAFGLLQLAGAAALTPAAAERPDPKFQGGGGRFDGGGASGGY
jgi:hypothetical protein